MFAGGIGIKSQNYFADFFFPFIFSRSVSNKIYKLFKPYFIFRIFVQYRNRPAKNEIYSVIRTAFLHCFQINIAAYDHKLGLVSVLVSADFTESGRSVSFLEKSRAILARLY